jgi:hypothetical protein
MSEIKEIIRSYNSIDDEIKALNKQLKPLKQTRDSLGEQIQEYLLSKSDKPNSTLEVGKYVFKIVNVNKKSYNKDILEDVIKQKTNQEVASSIISEVTQEKENSYLKRVTKK